MTELFVIYVASFLVPLLFRSWRIAIWGLAVQGIILGVIFAAHHREWTAVHFLEYLFLFVGRGVLFPWYLFRCMKRSKYQSDFALIHENLFVWMMALALLIMAFAFGNQMAPESSEQAWQFGTAAASVLIGMLILCNQSHRLGQIVGLLTLEGGLTLTEFLSPHEMPFVVTIGVSAVIAVFVYTCGQYLLSQVTFSQPVEPLTGIVSE
jgi:hydrogenase-4 membrane subunit HyfE